jgi:surface protein
MNSMFYRASSFHSDISNWDVSAVTNMGSMFEGASSFNSNISNWNVGRVTDMKFMFYEASSFNQNLCPWGPKLPSNFDHVNFAGLCLAALNVPTRTVPQDLQDPCVLCALLE